MSYVDLLNEIAALRVELNETAMDKNSKRKRLQEKLSQLAKFDQFNSIKQAEREYVAATTAKAWGKAYTESGALLTTVSLYDKSLVTEKPTSTLIVFKAVTAITESLTEAHDNSHTFAYLRVSTKDQSLRSQQAEVSKLYPNIEIHAEQGVSGIVPALERPVMSDLLTKVLRRGDTLVVWWIDRLGRDYSDASKTIQDLLNKGITIKTVNQGLVFAKTGDTLTDAMTDAQLAIIVGMAANERETRLASAEAGRQALSKDEWADKFKGKQADTELHQRIVESLANGISIRKTAEALSCGISTVQRVKKLWEKQLQCDDNKY